MQNSLIFAEFGDGKFAFEGLTRFGGFGCGAYKRRGFGSVAVGSNVRSRQEKT
jgi:hypothetical protein